MIISLSRKASKLSMSLEKIYQKKTQLEHILIRPDSYIGSVEPTTQAMWVWNEDKGLHLREITFVPGLFKIFDEILVNAADNKIRDKHMNCIKIKIDVPNNTISIWNNGKGIPVTQHKVEKMYIPEMIFGHLLTSSNFDDNEKKVTGGRNGYGAKLCNIFSKRFTIETSSKDFTKKYKQTWTNNMGQSSDPKLTDSSGPDFTCVTFEPDLSKFKMEVLNDDIVDLFSKRAFDIAATTCVRVYLNDQRLSVNDFKDYINLYTKSFERENVEEDVKVVHEKFSDRWEVAVTNSEKGFQSISFVNSICTSKGGTHVDYITDQIVTKLLEIVNRKNKGGIKIKPFQVKNHLCVFINCLVENPTFDSQTKENMTLPAKSFGSKCLVTEKFLNSISKIGCVENIMNWIHFKAQNQLNTKCLSKKQSRLKGIPKLDDANDAGTKHSLDCTLILTEGDSAKTLAVSGLAIVGRDRFGIFPLRGKLLNVREATHKQLMENAEINNVIKILGLQYKKHYNTLEDLKTLRYGKVMIMSDQDQDGSHIKGLIINFIHYNWPSLIKMSFMDQFITPIVKISKGKEEKSFFSLPEFYEWKRLEPNWNHWKIKYYKGLGTSSATEAKEYFNNMAIHRIKFKYHDEKDDDAILLAFSRKRIEDRKVWLKSWMETRKARRLQNLPEPFLYGKNGSNLTYSDFVNKELVLFSNMDNERSIPNICDGLKPGQRKVLFTCFKRNDKREVKVAQLAGSISELSAYHHGEASLMGTIINLAQNFVGSNNINLLEPVGQFGTRLNGGKDAASPRYIFTKLSPLARHIFAPLDDPLFTYLQDDNLKIEPEFYVPIIPMVLVNGAEGIGTGWSTKIPNYDVHDIITNLRLLINASVNNETDTVLNEMMPKYKGFQGEIIKVDDERIATFGEIRVLSNEENMDDIDYMSNRGDQQNKDYVELEISELPIKKWTQDYKESVLEIMLNGSDKVQPVIMDYKDYNTDVNVNVLVKISRAKYAEAQKEGLHKFFKLQNLLSTSSMVLFDSNGVIKRYDKPEEILLEFFEVRFTYYKKRKDYLLGLLTAEAKKLDFQARFILEKIKGDIVIENKKKKDLIDTLIKMGYEGDPVSKWKQRIMGDEYEEENVIDEDESSPAGSVVDKSSQDFEYLLGMKLWNLTKEKVDELIQKQKSKNMELNELKQKSPQTLWLTDLDNLVTEIHKLHAKESAYVKEAAMKLESGKSSKFSKRPTVPKKQQKGSYNNKPGNDVNSAPGQRVIPEVDNSLKVKIEKAKELKGKKIKAAEDGKNGIKETKDAVATEMRQPMNGHDIDEEDDDDDLIVVDDMINCEEKIDKITENDDHFNTNADDNNNNDNDHQTSPIPPPPQKISKELKKRTNVVTKTNGVEKSKKQKKINTFLTSSDDKNTKNKTNNNIVESNNQMNGKSNNHEVREKKQPKKSRKIDSSGSDFDIEENDKVMYDFDASVECFDELYEKEPQSPLPLRARLGRSCVPKQFNFSDSDD